MGPLRSFESSGAEFFGYLRLLAGLNPHESILDIGCGCGLMALPLTDFLSHDGRYVGIDIDQPCINWCHKNIAASYDNFEFARIDGESWADASQPGSKALRFPYGDGTFDMILLKSVFTHMRPAEVDNYLGEVARLLSARGRCLATFFLLNQPQAERQTRGLNQIDFDFGDEIFRYRFQNSPESAAAHDERLIMELLAKHKLALAQPAMYGTWSGFVEGLSFQDLLLVQRSEG